MAEPPILVHIVDDEEAVRNSLAFLLEISGFAVRTYAGARAFLETPDIPPGGCLVTDLRMPEINGVELLGKLRREQRMLPAIVMTGHGDVHMAIDAMKQGAMDFIEKPFDEQSLIGAITRVVEKGSTPLNSEPALAETRRRLARLDPTDIEVLDGLVSGKPNKTIAIELGMSPVTVEQRRVAVMDHMGARTLAELVSMVMAVDPSWTGEA